MSLTPARPAPAVLGGLVLKVSADAFEVRHTQRKTVRPGGRQQLAWMGEGREMVGALREWTLSWSHLEELGDPLKRLLAHPGPHSLVLWQREYLAYAGDGLRTTFHLPWPQAVDTVPVPGGQPPARYGATARLGLEGAPLTVEAVDSATFAAGPPPETTLWLLHGGREAALAAPPEEGQVLYLDLVPLYTVAQAPQHQARYQGAIPQPLSLLLQEVG